MRNPPSVASLPDGASVAAQRCTVLGALTVVGDFWTLGVVRSVFNGASRFGDIQRELGIATNVLADRLDRLVAAGVLERVPYGSQGGRRRYALTPAGEDLGPVLLALRSWGERHARRGEGSTWRHAGCSSAVEVDVRCPDCGATPGVADLEVGGGGGEEPGGRSG